MHNMMTGDNSGAEPREHYHECRTNCPWANDRSRDEQHEYFDTSNCPNGHGTHECDCDDVAYNREMWP